MTAQINVDTKHLKIRIDARSVSCAASMRKSRVRTRMLSWKKKPIIVGRLIAASLMVLMVPANAAQWQRIADFNDGTLGGTAAVNSGVDTIVSVENGNAVLQPVTTEFLGGLKVKHSFARKAIGVRVGAKTENCAGQNYHSLDIITNTGKFANSTEVRRVYATFQQNFESLQTNSADLIFHSYRTEPSQNTEAFEAEIGSHRTYNEGARITIAMTYDRSRIVSGTGKKFAAQSMRLNARTPETMERADRTILIRPYASVPGSCRVLVDYVDVLLP